MAFWCISFMRVLMLVFGILRLATFSMDCLCIAPLTHDVIVIRGFAFHPLFHIVLISGSYFVCFVWGLVHEIYHGNMWIQLIVLYGCVKVARVSGCGVGRLVCKGCFVSVWLGIGNLFVGMYISGAIMGRLVIGSCYWGCLRLLVWKIGYVCWLVMSELWGVMPCCGGLFLDLSYKGVRTINLSV